ncbi:MAG TPA: PP2C family protein-serine/threonine phosphatase, partial [Rhodothermales bacterium]|nr:PP2C family protein-serine/threonine phosphatase [Rhodothermales bacterium]
PPVLLRAGGNVAALPKTGGVPVAAVKEFAYASQQVVIEPGDGLLLYTDGVVEAMNPAREQFELERLFETLRDVSGLSPQQRVERVTRAVDSFAAGALPHDDVTLLYVQRTGA